MSDLPAPAELGERWAALTIAERGALLRQLFDCVFVLRGGPIERRLHACLRGTGPERLPRPHSPKSERSDPVDLAALAPTPRLTKGSRRPWLERRVRAAVGRLLDGRERWPAFQEFQQAGLGLAYRQLETWGGPQRWAAEYGLSYDEEKQALRAWSEERVRRELGAYLEGREGFPTLKQFDADGRSELRLALSKCGGLERWAAEFGRELGWRQRPGWDWTEERIEAALRALTAETGKWPSQFYAARMPGLYNAVACGAERERWARKLGLALPPQARRAPPLWDERRIENALRPLLRGRRVYPTQREFDAVGLDRLFQAITSRPVGISGLGYPACSTMSANRRSASARSSIPGRG